MPIGGHAKKNSIAGIQPLDSLTGSGGFLLLVSLDHAVNTFQLCSKII